MLFLTPSAKKHLESAVRNDFQIDLLEYFKQVQQIIEQDEELDFTGLKDRIKWFLGKITNNRDVLTQWQQTDIWKEVFKDIVINVGENIEVTIKGQQVSGNTKALVLAYIIYAYLFITSLKTVEQTEQIGGALVLKASKIFLAEAAKRADLSNFEVTGEPLRIVGEKISEEYPLANILASTVCILLLDKSFSKVHREVLLLLVNIVKTPLQNSVNYIYTVLVKLQDLYPIKTEFLAKDIKEQFKAIGIYSEEE